MPSPWKPFGRIAEAERRLQSVEPIYRALLAMRRHLASEDETLPCEAAVIAAIDIAVDISASSGILWQQHPDLVDALHKLAASLYERRKREPAPPVTIATLRDVLRSGRTPEST
jgi:hypothetical protein